MTHFICGTTQASGTYNHQGYQMGWALKYVEDIWSPKSEAAIWFEFPDVMWCWLVVYLPLWKIWKSVGMMKFPIYIYIYMEKWKLFQTTNQDVIALIRTCTRISSLSYPVSYILFNGCDFRAKSKIIQRKTKQTALANSKEWTATPLLHEIVQSWLLRFLYIYIYIYPLVNCPITMEDHNFEWVNQLFLWPF